MATWAARVEVYRKMHFDAHTIQAAVPYSCLPPAPIDAEILVTLRNRWV